MEHPMSNVIACRPGCYGVPLDEAMKLLAELGVEGVEAGAPKDGDYQALAEMAEDAGVKITTIASSGVHLDDPEHVAKLEQVIDGAAQIGTKIIFLSSKVKDGSAEDGYPVLKDLGDKAAAKGVVLSLETHPPYGMNGDEARKTLEAIGSDGVGYNFDTANIYYYNEPGIDTVEELKKALDLVTSVHLKESAKGEPKSMDFPILGTGIVDFPEVFRLLGERGFAGPYTMELEGPLVKGLPTEERHAKVKACVDYLRSISAL
jgi:sugar phosphate isomerase/epimerase